MRRSLHRQRAPGALVLPSLAAACSSPPAGANGGIDGGTDAGATGTV